MPDELVVCDDCSTDKTIEILENFKQKVILDGRDVSSGIRTEKISNLVSPYSKNLVMRAKLLEMQRAYANEADVIMEGRDITTVVFPNAELKIYLDASASLYNFLNFSASSFLPRLSYDL